MAQLTIARSTEWCTAEQRQFTADVATAMMERHRMAQFRHADHAVAWLQDTYGNPRMKTITNDEGTTSELQLQRLPDGAWTTAMTITVQ
jgi:hypothetical protein